MLAGSEKETVSETADVGSEGSDRVDYLCQAKGSSAMDPVPYLGSRCSRLPVVSAATLAPGEQAEAVCADHPEGTGSMPAHRSFR